jgi:hypothetical protein
MAIQLYTKYPEMSSNFLYFHKIIFLFIYYLLFIFFVRSMTHSKNECAEPAPKHIGNPILLTLLKFGNLNSPTLHPAADGAILSIQATYGVLACVLLPSAWAR